MTSSRRTLILSIAVAATAVVSAASVLGAQDVRPVAPYGSTLTYGTGLVSIPVAWASPSTGDLFASISARKVNNNSNGGPGVPPQWDLTGSLEAHIAGRLTLGGSLYGTDHEQFGAFGQFVMVQQPASGPRWIPSIAVGVRNLGSSKYQDRFVTGGERVVDVLGDTGKKGDRGTFNGSPTIYGVMTREFQWTRNSASITVGYGNGLFKETGGLDTVNNRTGTIAAGLFLGARLVTPLKENGQIAWMVENNGFDWNAGLNYSVGHVSIGLFMTEIEEKGQPDGSRALANFPKFSALVSYNASIPGIIRGSTQRAEAADAQLELRRLEQEVEQRRQTTRRLVAALQKAGATADAASLAQQKELSKQLDAERAAMKAAADKLEALQKKPPEQPR